MNLLFELAPFVTIAFGFLNFYALQQMYVLNVEPSASGIEERKYWSFLFGAFNFGIFFLIETVLRHFKIVGTLLLSLSILLTFLFSYWITWRFLATIIKSTDKMINKKLEKNGHTIVSSIPVFDQFMDVGNNAALLFIINFSGKIIQAGRYQTASDAFSGSPSFIFNEHIPGFKNESEIDPYLSKYKKDLKLILDDQSNFKSRTYIDSSNKLKYILVEMQADKNKK